MHGFMQSDEGHHKVPKRWVEAVLSSAAVAISTARFARLANLPATLMVLRNGAHVILPLAEMDPWYQETQVCCTRLKDQSILATRKHRASYSHVWTSLVAGIRTGTFQSEELEPDFQKYLASTFAPEDLLAFQSTLALTYTR